MATGYASERKRFVPIRTDSLVDNTAAHFDVYTLLEGGDGNAKPEDFLLYAKAPYTWTLRELTDLTRVGIQDLFIDESQRRNYDRYLRLHLETPEIDRNEEPRFRIRKVQDIGQHLVESCFLSDIDQQVVGKLEGVANELVLCLKEDPKSVHHIQSLAEYDLYTYVHSVGVGTLTTAVAMKMGISDPEELKTYAMGGILHDVGKKLVPLQVLNKPGPLLPEEWEMMKAHPTTGFELLKALDLPKEVLEIVASHHEKIDGSGYPDGLMGNEIPVHVQVATIADIFNALTTTRCYHRKRSRFEALMFMKHHLRGKVSPDVFNALVACLVSEKELKDE
ncbi:MAG: HD domain-containing protein [Silvanigrellales bacterium]|nr:HD domain-containing protein [Silvanigrellales bacterium]